MRRRTILSVALGVLAISILCTTTTAQTSTYVADTGLIDLPAGQTLRVSVAASGPEAVTVRFKKMEYIEAGITDGILRKQVGAQSTTQSVVLSGDECLVFFLGGTGTSVRVQILSSSQNLKANAVIVTPASGGSNGGSTVLLMDQISFNRTGVATER